MTSKLMTSKLNPSPAIRIEVLRCQTRAILLSFLVTLGVSTQLPAQRPGTVEIDVLEEKSGDPLTCRVQILDERGRPQRARGAVQFDQGWNLIESPLVFRGRPGKYTHQVVSGPEFSPGNGEFVLDSNSEGYDVLRLPRHADMDEESWIGGDLECLISPPKTLDWLRAEHLHMGVAVTSRPQNKDLTPLRSRTDNRWVDRESYRDVRNGSGLTLHHWLPPAEVPESLPSARLLVLAKPDREPSVDQASRDGSSTPRLPVLAEITRPWARDVSIWLASQRIDTVQVLGPHLTMDGKGATRVRPIIEPEPEKYWTPSGQPRDALAPGRFVESLYWQMLEAGLQLAPSAGSGFGKNGSPLGYNRVYTHLPGILKSTLTDEPTETTPKLDVDLRRHWWRALREGRSFVTSGPLLRAQINELTPGALFRADAGDKITLTVSLVLTVGDPVDYLDVIFNGEKLYEARLDEYAKQGGRIPPLTVDQSGWIIVRVVTGREHTYRIAMTAPYYVQIGEHPRISRKAVEFFQSWLEKSAELISQTPQSDAYEPYIQSARRFWAQRLEQSNAP